MVIAVIAAGPALGVVVTRSVAGLKFHANAVVKTLAALDHRGEVHRILPDGKVFWWTVVEPSCPTGKGGR